MRRQTGMRKVGPTWFGRYTDAQGRRHEKSLGKRYDVAVEMFLAIKAQVRRAKLGIEDPTAQLQPVEALAREFVAQKEIERPAHAKALRASLREMLIGIRTVSDLTVVAIERARARVRGSNRTKNKKAEAVISLCRWIRRTGRGHPPAEAIRPLPKAPVKTRRALSRSEADRLQAAVDGGPVGDLVAVLLGSGLRLTEALRLTWEDLTPRGLVVKESKNGDPRTVPIPEALRARLGSIRTVPGGPRILLSPRGCPMDDRPWSKELLQWLRKGILAAGISPVGLDFHALRHTYATWAAAAGATALQLMALLGWRSVSMAERYVHREMIDTSSVVHRMGVDVVSETSRTRESSG